MEAHGTDALRLWRHFLSQAFVRRLDPSDFAALVPLQQFRSPLSPTLIADLLVRPHAKNNYAPDPLVPGYIDALLRQRLVTPAGVLFALARYSSARQEQQSDKKGAAGADGQDEKQTREKQSALRWANSYTIEQVVFLRLAKAAKQDNAVRSMKDAVEMVRILIRWMSLFSDMAAAFAADVMGAIHRNNVKLELECSRSAFVLLLSSVCDSPAVLTALTGASAKGRHSTTCWLLHVILTPLPKEVENSSRKPLPSSLPLFQLPRYHRN
jgi:mediator of RNA polymerase II transcription subunit 5